MFVHDKHFDIDRINVIPSLSSGSPVFGNLSYVRVVVDLATETSLLRPAEIIPCGPNVRAFGIRRGLQATTRGVIGDIVLLAKEQRDWQDCSTRRTGSLLAPHIRSWAEEKRV